MTLSDDKTLRAWDKSTGKEIKKIEFSTLPMSMEISKDGSIITTTHSNIVTFWDSRESVY